MENPFWKQWQATIHYGNTAEAKDTTIVYGSTLVSLRHEALSWLQEHQPTFLRRGPVTYLYSDGTYPAPSARWEGPKGPLSQGWYKEEHARQGKYAFAALPFTSFKEVIADFVVYHLVPEKGPDYEEKLLIDGVIQLHLVKTLWRESDEAVANWLIQRGWHLLALDQQGIVDSDLHQLISKQTIAVLGHPEENALYYDTKIRS